jgi:hypothetical protein
VSKNADRFLPYLTVRPPVIVAELRGDAGIVGAALVAARAARLHLPPVRKAATPAASASRAATVPAATGDAADAELPATGSVAAEVPTGDPTEER